MLESKGEKERDSLQPSERRDDVRKHWEKLKVANVWEERGENEAGKQRCKRR